MTGTVTTQSTSPTNSLGASEDVVRMALAGDTTSNSLTVGGDYNLNPIEDEDQSWFRRARRARRRWMRDNPY